MATKKPAPKKAAVKPTAKPVAKKVVAKPAAKKAITKPAAKKAAPKPAPKKSVTKPVATKPAAKKVVAKPVAKPVAKKVVAKPTPKPVAKKTAKVEKNAKIEKNKKVEKAEKVKKVEKIEKIKPIKEKKIKEPKQPKAEKVADDGVPIVKTRKPRAKKAKRIIRVPKPPKPVKAAGIEKATTVIPVKKIQPKVKEEVNKNFKVPKITAKSSVAYSPGYVPMDRRKEEDAPQAPLVRYSDFELNEFRDLITKKLEAAKKELAYLQGVITHKGDMGDSTEGHFMSTEDGSMTMEREQMSNMASRQITFIEHLEKALARIENKTYGVCRVTGKLIDKARLRAVPHATLSLEAKLGLVKLGE